MTRIHYHRTGGGAGMPIRAAIDTAPLSPERAAELRSLVDAAGFFQLPREVGSSGASGDRFIYRLVIEEEGRQHTVDVG